MSLTAPLKGTDGLEPGAGLPDPGLMVLLRRAGALIDSMWNSALADSGDFTAVQLAEASQGVHRALIALSTLERAALGSPS
ncbi:MAG TPA: hypothetical protein VFN68_04195 [Acidimicrobiales bacterium]|nr:hypothetical protein [Acidimicrobiales bacterium]